MIEHPVPQNVTSYEFHLVGNMTLKQFLELAVGVIIAIGIYGSNLYPIVKWPLVGLFVLAGVAFAFLPINERPLDAWFLAFIRAIYNPTKYFWKRNSLKPEVFSFQASTNPRSQAKDTPKRTRDAGYALYSSTLPQKSAQPAEDSDPRVQEILSLYDLHPDAPLTLSATKTTGQDSTELSNEVVMPLIDLENTSIDIGADEEAQSSASFTQTPPINTDTIPQQPAGDQANNTQAGMSPVMIKQINSTPITIDAADKPIEVYTKKAGEKAVPQAGGAHVQQIQRDRQSFQDAESATTNTNLPFPSKPTKPNLVVGMTISNDGHIIEDVIVEIRDENAVPVRAFRSNKLGQFFISTPLPNGEYTIVADKDGFAFDTIKLALSGVVVDPVEVRAQE